MYEHEGHLTPEGLAMRERFHAEAASREADRQVRGKRIRRRVLILLVAALTLNFTIAGTWFIAEAEAHAPISTTLAVWSGISTAPFALLVVFVLYAVVANFGAMVKKEWNR